MRSSNHKKKLKNKEGEQKKMKKHQIPLTALAAFAVLLAAPSFAQEQSGSAEKIHSLDEIVAVQKY
ncbi:MAG: hypothetical protein D3904_15440, partial [Candidatus Electrothrix sp. EH2]|nr:hypothetical protein [Candidatus Electrothrix sp. EH2]